MGKVYEIIDDQIRAWLSRQTVFFVSTAPMAGDGLINCSPKGLDSLRVIGPRQLAYLDLAGSGIETVAHLRENGRIVIMLCAFDGPPLIYRFHGTGTVVLPGSDQFAELLSNFNPLPGIRSIISVEVSRISDSCGYGVPRLDFHSHREALGRWCEKKGPAGLAAYQAANNASSIDGLPGLTPQ